MTNTAVNFFAGALYVSAAVVLWRNMIQGEPARSRHTLALLLALAAIVVHAVLLYGELLQAGGINLALAGAFSLVAWVVACLYLVASLWRPVDYLGVIIMPLAASTLLLGWLWPQARPTAFSSGTQSVHIVVSILAYSLLSLAAVQSVMLLAQEKHLRRKHAYGFVRALPPMQTIEELMFRMIALGFVLLTLTLISGVFFSERLFGTPFKFTHHMVLAVLGWIVYAVLLLGRWRFGWRGRAAARWTLGGFALLLLAYFGSKLVLEVILGR